MHPTRTHQSVIKTTFPIVKKRCPVLYGFNKRNGGPGMDHQTLEAIRLMAVERVARWAASIRCGGFFGFHGTTIYRWINAASQPGVGLKALQARPAPGRSRSLTPGQERQVFGGSRVVIVVWPGFRVVDTICGSRTDRAQFAIRLGVTAVGELLAKLGLTPQKPLQRAYQRDPAAIKAWRRERFPAIARRAKASGGEVYFWIS